MPTETVQISIRAQGLSNVAGAFKGTSDPFAVVTVLPKDRDSKPRILGKTEVIKNSLDPDFTKTFTVDYELGSPVSVLIKIFDEVRKGENVPMGSGVFEMGAVLGAKGNTKAKKMKSGGSLFVTARKAEGEGTLHLKMEGIELTNTEGFMKKSDPFYEFKRKDVGPRGTEWNIVHRSDKIKNSLNPKWEDESIDLSILCGGNVDLPLSLSIYDYESSGDHVLMGSVETSVSGLVAAKATSGLTITKDGEGTGTIAVGIAAVHGIESLEDKMAALDVAEPAEEEEDIVVAPISLPPPMPSAPPIPFTPPPPVPPSFLDYINGGCEMQLCVAIDFTESNGDPTQPGTLHYIDREGGTMNDYERAISSIGGILADFDPDQKFHVWGFGADFNCQVFHSFQCGPDAEVEGVRGVIDAYHKTFESGLVMSNPRVFTEVIEKAAVFAERAQEQAQALGKQKYTTLLILTNGAVSDVMATAQALNASSETPLSIIIVGIGSADASSMQFLDEASSRDKPDICHFVEYNKHRHNFNSLTAATLYELPSQMVAYFQRSGIDPLPMVEVSDEEIVIGPAEEEIDFPMNFGEHGEIIVEVFSGIWDWLGDVGEEENRDWFGDNEGMEEGSIGNTILGVLSSLGGESGESGEEEGAGILMEGAGIVLDAVSGAMNALLE